MTESADIAVTRDGALVTVTLNRPERKNAITQTMWLRIPPLFAELGEDPTVRAIVVTGAGNAFCSGADISRLRDDLRTATLSPAERMRSVSEAIPAIQRVPKPTVARVLGPAVGGGFGIALACDLVVAGESATFHPAFTRRALSPDSGMSWFLPRIVGLHKAKQLALLSPAITASEALQLGLASVVVPDEELDAAVAAVVAPLLEGPTVALAATKELLNESLLLTLDEALAAEARAQGVNFQTEDNAEALTAFIEKRTPRFTGR